MYQCPICLQITLKEKSVYKAEHVALGEAVCSLKCHYDSYHACQYLAEEEYLPCIVKPES